ERIAGDVNHNCILDAGDVIALFSDGVDDDANGYTDDIAGWDFFKNDNDPYDDTRAGRGTDAARVAAAKGNDGIRAIGICPRCRVVPLRVGDAFVADVNDLAKAVIYASDGGAAVVSTALTTIDMTPFARAAIDYAYVHRVTVVATMADLGLRHHTYPASALHV